MMAGIRQSASPECVRLQSFLQQQRITLSNANTTEE